jgi:hypothetical protein
MMSIYDQIMATKNPFIGNESVNAAWEYSRMKCADIAEAREKELLADKAALIAELRGLAKYAFDAGYSISTNQIHAILDKYEGKP